MSQPALDPELQRYVRGLARTLVRGDQHMAEDIAQDAFVAAVQNAPRDRNAMRAWLGGIVRNSFNNRRRQVAQRPRSVAYTVGAHDRSEVSSVRRAIAIDPARDAQHAEVRLALRAALDRIPEHYASVITMRVVDGMPPREIAAALGMPVETVRTRTRRGFDKLRAELEEMHIGADALDPSRPLFTLPVLLATPRRRWVAAAMLVALPTIATIAWRSSAAGPADLVEIGRAGGPTVAAGEPKPVTAAPGNPGARTAPIEATAPAVASVEIRITGVRSGAPTLRLVPAEGGVALPWQAVEGAPKRFDDLAPGRWRLMGQDGVVLATRDLPPGETVWDVALAAPASLEVTVVTADGLPAEGATLFRRSGLTGLAKKAATTDARGRATLPPGKSGQWLAARGDVGLLSEAVLLDQPFVTHPGALRLELRRRDVDWTEVVLGPDAADITLTSEPVDRRELCSRSPRGGIRGLATWVPAWSDGRGRFAIVRGDTRKYLCVSSGSKVLWTGEAVGRAEELPEEIALHRPWTITGRLLSADGAPLSGHVLRVAPLRGARLSMVELTSDAQGHFRIPLHVGAEVGLNCNGVRVARAAPPAEGDTVNLGDVHHARPRERASLRCRVEGITAPFLAHGVTAADLRVPAATELATDGARRLRVIDDPSGAFALHAGPRDIRAIVIAPTPTGPPFPTTILHRPAEGWPDGEVTVTVDGDAERTVVEGSFDPARLPGRAQFRHLETGWRRTIDVTAKDGSFVSPPLGAGTWSISLQDRRGRFGECVNVALNEGERADLGLLHPRLGEIQLDWPEELEDLAPDATVQLLVIEGTRIECRFEATRAELEGPLCTIEVPEGSYRVALMRTGPGVLRKRLMGRCEVQPGGLSTATLRSGRIAVPVRFRAEPFLRQGGDVVLEAIGEDGSVLDREVLSPERLTRSPRAELVCPPDPRIRLVCTTTGGRTTRDVPFEARYPDRLVTFDSPPQPRTFESSLTTSPER